MESQYANTLLFKVKDSLFSRNPLNMSIENWHNRVVCRKQAKRSPSIIWRAFHFSFPCQIGCNMRDWSWKVVRLLNQPWNFVLSLEDRLCWTFRWFFTKPWPVSSAFWRRVSLAMFLVFLFFRRVGIITFSFWSTASRTLGILIMSLY